MAVTSVTSPGENSTHLASPVALTMREIDIGTTEILLAGEIVGEDGIAVPGAVVGVWGVLLDAEPEGGFEILAHGSCAGTNVIEIYVSAPGYDRCEFSLVVDDTLPIGEAEVAIRPSRLGDGTLVVLHTFVIHRTHG
ncbi:hypothetical protein [Rhodococcus artemisiae]|uniref:Carboxypeptidase regulatory-like domain-containing protein n=1 Tax=Rhodococcus artemisiae TaxID=714159 RepID=A0ABU7LKC6_9NOCA|nr:hypothetical protein [Rhodococcus artemisiae]MEE2062027.1 hypothetical protein [Rhodococcus artemisiae]